GPALAVVMYLEAIEDAAGDPAGVLAPIRNCDPRHTQSPRSTYRTEPGREIAAALQRRSACARSLAQALAHTNAFSATARPSAPDASHRGCARPSRRHRRTLRYRAPARRRRASGFRLSTSGTASAGRA